jgi:alcohol dehydrogenase
MIGKHGMKLELAAQAGARVVRLAETGGGDGGASARSFDVVVDATGSPGGLAAALRLVRPEGTVVLKTTHHGATSFQSADVVVNEVRLIGSRCGHFAPALQLLKTGGLDVDSLISHRFPLDEGIEAFRVAALPGSMKVLLSPGS